MGWILQDRTSHQFLALSGGEVDWTPRVDQATAFEDREEAVFAGLGYCDAAGFILREVVQKRSLNNAG